MEDMTTEEMMEWMAETTLPNIIAITKIDSNTLIIQKKHFQEVSNNANEQTEK